MRGAWRRLSVRRQSVGVPPPAFCGGSRCLRAPSFRDTFAIRRDDGIMTEIDAGRLALRPIELETARALLSGQTPPSWWWRWTTPLSSRWKSWTYWLVREAKVSTTSARFMVRRDDGAAIGEIGAFLELATRTAQVGYSVVVSCWGKGYATEALRGLVRDWQFPRIWTGSSPRRS